MTADDTAKKLDELIDLALKEDPAIRESYESAEFDGREINEELGRERDAIWEVTIDEAKKRDINKQDLEQREKRVLADVGEPPAEGANAKAASIDTFAAFLGLYLWALVGIAAFAFYRGWRPRLSTLLTLQGWAYPALAVAPLIGFLIVLASRQRRFARTEEARQAVYATLRGEWEARRDAAAIQAGIPTLRQTIEAQEKEIEKLLSQRVRSAMISAINRRLAPSYATTLSLRKPRGFGEVFDKKLMIITPARRRLEFMLKNMPGGSIGIAGSRGAGKTTLLKLFCGPKRVIEKLNDKPVLGVLVSAPVAYQARDFILYLFSTVCQNVIEAEGGKYRIIGTPKDAPEDPLDSATATALRRLPPMFIRAGLSIVAITLLVAFVLAAGQVPQPAPASTPSSAAAAVQPVPAPQPAVAAAPTAQPAPAAQSAAAAASSTQPAPAAQPAVTPTPSKQPSPSAATPANDLTQKFVAQLKLDPGGWFGSGILLLVIGLLMAEALQMGAWRSLLIAFARLLNSLLGRLPVYGTFTSRFLESQIRMAALEEATRRMPKRELEQDEAVPPSELRLQAEEYLKAIKFQQSYTTGWSGSLKLPVGVEGGVNRAVTLAQNQLSLPEVVHFLTSFLERVSLHYQVIIGIDEMDKLATDALAQRFLNDIKSIFGLEKCFYLISVSENAMSNFERRGIAFRDVFDSSFDDFVYVDYLDFQAAQELLEQRVVGRAIPFFGMSYCMSGGLPRDLIRNFRSVLEVYGGNPPVDTLSEVCKSIVNNDLRAKVRATRTSAKKIHLDPEVDEFLEILYDVEPRLDHFDLLTESGARILDMGKRLSAANGNGAAARAASASAASSKARRVNASKGNEQADKDGAQMRGQLADLADELGTYVYYAVTLRQFFTDQVTPAPFTKPPMGGDLDSLAKARQVLAVNPSITRSLLKTFRASHTLPGLPN